MIFLKIEKLDNQTVRVVLSSNDLADFALTYESMNYSDEVTKKAILMIVRQIKQQTGLPVESVQLFIEAFPHEQDGCILYVNLIESMEEHRAMKRCGKGFETPIGVEFDTVEILAEACQQLLQEFGHLVTNSSLYLYQHRYRLLLYTYCKMEKKIIGLLSEYGRYLGKGALLSAFNQEHGKAIVSDHAIETIIKYLG